MTPDEFIRKWRLVELKERSASQSHFNDLCRLLDIPDPATDDPKGEWFTFEKGASKTTGGEGWADVWRKGCFAWEYKGKRKDLDAAYVLDWSDINPLNLGEPGSPWDVVDSNFPHMLDDSFNGKAMAA